MTDDTTHFEADSGGIPVLKIALGAGLALVAAILFMESRRGQLVPSGENPVPFQSSASGELARVGDFTIHALDSYRVQAMIVSRERYYFGTEAQLSPVDFALAWGPVTRAENLENLRFSQSGRWYYFHWKDASKLSVTPREIALNSANTHILPDPAQPELRETLLGFEKGDTVLLEGYLVEIHGPNGWHWVSSRSRSDTGGGSCEVLFVTRAERVIAPE